jgi:hypothetical protein
MNLNEKQMYQKQLEQMLKTTFEVEGELDELKKASLVSVATTFAPAVSDANMSINSEGVRITLCESLNIQDEVLKKMPIQFAASNLKLSADAFSDMAKATIMYNGSKKTTYDKLYSSIDQYANTYLNEYLDDYKINVSRSR